MEEATGWLLHKLPGKKRAALAGATPYLRLFGVATGGVLLAKGAISAVQQSEHGTTAAGRVLEARHFAESLLGEAEGLKYAVMHGGEIVMQADAVLGAR